MVFAATISATATSPSRSKNDSTVQGARYGVAGFTYDGGHINLTNYGSITGAVDAIDVNFNGVLPSPVGPRRSTITAT